MDKLSFQSTPSSTLRMKCVMQAPVLMMLWSPASGALFGDGGVWVKEGDLGCVCEEHILALTSSYYSLFPSVCEMSNFYPMLLLL